VKYKAIIVLLISFISCVRDGKSIRQTKAEQEFESGISYDFIVKNIITGDFDGDGNEDELKESLVSSINNKSIDALPQVEFDSLVGIVHKMNPILSLQSKSKNIPELILTKTPSFGLMWIKNEGDLNKDGTDEISIVIDWADWSQVNTCIVYSLKNNKWIEYAKFDVREWQITRNPDFNGFITKNKKGIYEVSTFDSEVIEIVKPLNELLLKPAHLVVCIFERSKCFAKCVLV
jgi:hypothetical protein